MANGILRVRNWRTFLFIQLPKPSTLLSPVKSRDEVDNIVPQSLKTLQMSSTSRWDIYRFLQTARGSRVLTWQ